MDTSIFDEVTDQLENAKDQVMTADGWQELRDAVVTLVEATQQLASLTRDKLHEAAKRD